MTLACGEFRHLVFQVRPTLQWKFSHCLAMRDDAGQAEALTQVPRRRSLLQAGRSRPRRQPAWQVAAASTLCPGSHEDGLRRHGPCAGRRRTDSPRQRWSGHASPMASRQRDCVDLLRSANDAWRSTPTRYCLTFDMRGGRKQAKPDCGRPLDGRVRRRCFAAHDAEGLSGLGYSSRGTPTSCPSVEQPADKLLLPLTF